jgi:hypothetical protein
MAIEPGSRTPFTWITAALVPFTAAWSAARVVTTWGVALPPPVVVETPLPDSAAQPVSGLGAGGVVQELPEEEEAPDEELAPDEDDDAPLDDDEAPEDEELAPDDDDTPLEEDEAPDDDEGRAPLEDEEAPEDEELAPDEDDEAPLEEDEPPDDDGEGPGVQLRVVTGDPPVHWAGSALVTVRVWVPSAWHVPQSE